MRTRCGLLRLQRPAQSAECPRVVLWGPLRAGLAQELRPGGRTVTTARGGVPKEVPQAAQTALPIELPSPHLGHLYGLLIGERSGYGILRWKRPVHSHFQIRTAPSGPPSANKQPSPERVAITPRPASPRKVRIILPSLVCHRISVASSETLARVCPLGEKTTLRTGAVWPLRIGLGI